MTKDKIGEALRGRLRCMYASDRGTSHCDCGNVANADGHIAGYMASGRGSICRLMSDVSRGTTCSSCDYRCGEWYGKLLACQDDGEVREVLGKACKGWTPTLQTNRIPGEAEP